jgi:hypothetical protein
MGTDGATAEPPMRGAIRSGAAVRAGGDDRPPSSGEADEGRGGARRCGAGIAPRRPGLAQRFVEQPGQGLGFCGALASALVGCEGRLGHGAWLVGPSAMEEQTDAHASNDEELLTHRVRRHDESLFPRGARGPFYCLRPPLNYPLDRGTRPITACTVL